MRTKKMRHKTLGDVVIDVPESAVKHHERSGWELVEGSAEPAAAPAAAAEPAAPAAAKPTPTTTDRRLPKTDGSAD